ncbi:MAG: hypothetical protein ABIK94_02665 [candidate division WOR-3 bacterium]
MADLTFITKEPSKNLKEIGQLVYQLHNLTEKEIKIVEGCRL